MAPVSLKDPSHLYQTMRTADHAVRPGFGIHEMELDLHQTVPWHSHSQISDTFYVISGILKLSLREPEEVLFLHATHCYRVAPERPHKVENGGDGPLTVLVLQGVGEYDYLPLSEQTAQQ